MMKAKHKNKKMIMLFIANLSHNSGFEKSNRNETICELRKRIAISSCHPSSFIFFLLIFKFIIESIGPICRSYRFHDEFEKEINEKWIRDETVTCLKKRKKKSQFK